MQQGPMHGLPMGGHSASLHSSGTPKSLAWMPEVPSKGFLPHHRTDSAGMPSCSTEQPPAPCICTHRGGRTWSGSHLSLVPKAGVRAEDATGAGLGWLLPTKYKSEIEQSKHAH